MNTTDSAKWLDDFMVELRLRDVPGVAIGDAVATVEEHCSDSGEDAESAFGDAREYARSLDLPTSPIPPAEMGRLVTFGAMYMTGIFLFLTSGRDALAGEDIAVTVSAVVILLGFLALFITAVYRLEWVVRSPAWQPVILVGALVTAMVVAGVSTHGLVLTVAPALLLAILGLAMMVMPPLYSQFFDSTSEDPLIDPRMEQPPQRRRSRLQNMGISLGVPAGLVLWLVITGLLGR